MHVHSIPALSDNFMYLFHAKNSTNCIAVDPVEPEKIESFLNKLNLNLIAVLTTHHHWDHAGGNKKLKSKFSNIPFYGGDDRIEGLTVKVKHDQTLDLDKLKVKCLFTPCHTKGHMSYFVTEDSSSPTVFTGDTLFIAGCGKFFEGGPQDMYNSLNILSSLPENTKVYCGHEYTVNNLKFAKSVDPKNEEVIKKYEWAMKKIGAGEATVPSTIGDELKFNPFMRVNQPALQHKANSQDPVKVMQVIRHLKDKF